MPLLTPDAFRRLLTSGKTLLCDGAMGTELIERGTAVENVMRANLVDAATVRSIHDAAIGAGADLITSNTFGPRTMGEWLPEFQAGAEIAVAAARESARTVGVWLSAPGFVVPREVHTLRSLSALPDWPKMLLVETCTSLDEAREAVRSASTLQPEVLAVTAHFGSNGRMPDGATPEAFVNAVIAEGAHIVGANCGDSPEQFIETTRRMRSATAAPLMIQPSAGIPEVDEDGRWRYSVDHARFARVLTCLADAGANIVGGCCGTTPLHIAAARQGLPMAGIA